MIAHVLPLHADDLLVALYYLAAHPSETLAACRAFLARRVRAN